MTISPVSNQLSLIRLSAESRNRLRLIVARGRFGLVTEPKFTAITLGLPSTEKLGSGYLLG